MILAFLALLSAATDSVDAADTLSLSWADREDSLAVVAQPAPAPEVRASAGADSSRPVRPGSAPGTGAVSGRVLDASGRALARAAVVLSGAGRTATSDEQGRWEIPDVAPGRYGLLVAAPGFDPWTDSLEVVDGRERLLASRLRVRALREERVTISGQASRRTEAALLFARREAPAVSDGISAEQIGKGPDGDAASAVRRVTGLSVGSDGLVYVRGLGERYVNVQLDGMTLSSPDPEKRVIPLDLFPTRLLDGLDVAKTFTPDQPGEFAGGSVRIRTKEAPDEGLFEVSAGITWVPGTSFGRMWGYDGGSLDWLGWDDGSRQLPDELPDYRFSKSTTTLGSTKEERKAAMQKIIDAFTGVWNPRREFTPPNQSYGLTAGDRYRLGGDWSLGWLAGGSWSGGWSHDEEDRANIGLQADSSFSVVDTWTREKSTQTVLAGGLGTVTLKQGSDHAIGVTAVYNHSWEDQVVRTYGLRTTETDTTLTWEIRNQYQTLVNLRLHGRHGDPKGDGPRLEWALGRSTADRDEPDLRTSRYTRTQLTDDETGETWYAMLATPTGSYEDRWWYALRETGGSGRVALDLPDPWIGRDGSRFELGAYAQAKRRSFDVHRVTFIPSTTNTPELEDLLENGYEAYWDFLDGSSDSGYLTNTLSLDKDDYGVSDRQASSWLEARTKWASWLRSGVGARLAWNRVHGTAADTKGNLSESERAIAICDSAGTTCVINFGYDEVNLLPAVSLAATPTEKTTMRLSWTRTMAFPEYREMAPLLVNLVTEGIEQVGNPSLAATKISNWDARAEWYPSGRELLAVSLFRKDFTDPVEATLVQVGSNQRASYANAASAEVVGVELESRVNLERAWERLSAYQIQLNWTGIRSRVDGTTDRPLQGQAPYLFNAMLFGEWLDGGVQASLLYNLVGRRLGAISTSLFPDIYDEARQSLDASVTFRLDRSTKLRLAGKNLTDAAQRSTQGGITVRRSQPGSTWSASLSHAF